MRGGVGKGNKPGSAHRWTMSSKAEDDYCRFPRPYTAFPHRGDAPSPCILGLKVHNFACKRLRFAQALEVYPVCCDLVTYADQ
jgi:hypothetical protein